MNGEADNSRFGSMHAYIYALGIQKVNQCCYCQFICVNNNNNVSYFFLRLLLHNDIIES